MSFDDTRAVHPSNYLDHEHMAGRGSCLYTTDRFTHRALFDTNGTQLRSPENGTGFRGGHGKMGHKLR